MKRKHHELESIRHSKLVQDRRNVVSNGCFADEQTFGQIHVPGAGADVGNDFAFTPGQRINLSLDLPVSALT